MGVPPSKDPQGLRAKAPPELGPGLKKAQPSSHLPQQGAGRRRACLPFCRRYLPFCKR